MNEYDPAMSEVPEFKGIEMHFGERTLTLTPENTVIRRFVEDLREFDHCIHAVDEQVVAFAMEEGAMQELAALGFRVQCDEVIDAATIEYYVCRQADKHLNDELTALLVANS